VYAGGDDLFLIGPWNLIPTLAQNIQQDFSRYVNHHPACHISAGMAFIHGKFPLYQAAYDAGESLDRAKALNGKSAFTFLQKPWKWDDFSQIEEKQKILVHLTQALNGPKSILQLLQQMATAEIESQQKHAQDRVWGPWMWRGNYMFTRILEQEGDSQRKEIIKEIFTDLKTNLYTDLQQWGVAARWAQLFIRNLDA
jgi:CRISPR-associated protein Csm1